jgi:hypothetical protein
METQRKKTLEQVFQENEQILISTFDSLIQNANSYRKTQSEELRAAIATDIQDLKTRPIHKTGPKTRIAEYFLPLSEIIDYLPEENQPVITATLKTINDISLKILHPQVKSLGGKLSHIQGLKASEISKVVSESEKFISLQPPTNNQGKLHVYLKQVCSTFGEVDKCLDFNIHLFDPNIDRRQKDINYSLHFKKYAIFGSVRIYFSDLLIRLQSDHNYEQLKADPFNKLINTIESILKKLDLIIDHQAKLLARYK